MAFSKPLKAYVSNICIFIGEAFTCWIKERARNLSASFLLAQFKKSSLSSSDKGSLKIRSLDFLFDELDAP